MRIMEGHTDEVWSVDMDSGCRTAVSGSQDKMFKLWDLGTAGACGPHITFQFPHVRTDFSFHQTVIVLAVCHTLHTSTLVSEPQRVHHIVTDLAITEPCLMAH